MAKVKDLAGRRFGRLTAISYELKPNGKSGTNHAVWKCICDCGRTAEVYSTHLLCGSTLSCGCLHKELLAKRVTTHGMTHQRFYRIYKSMKIRTTYKCSPSFKNYGAKGINICDRWLTFENFKDDMYLSYLNHVQVYGELNTTIERKDNAKDYSPENCTWATRKEQSLNRTNVKKYLIQGELLALSEIAEKYNLHVETVFSRIKNGWDAERIISRPMFKEG